MSNPLRLCLVGATGLIGSRLIARAVGREDVRVTGVARREAKLPKGARMEMLLAEPDGWNTAISAAQPQVLVCALGTTWRKAGKDAVAFQAVDRDLVIDSALAAKQAGARQMILISAVGAAAGSKHIYLRTKGEVEAAVSKLGFHRLDIIRPALLRGPRQESRPLEWLGIVFSPLMDLFLFGGLRKYHSIKADVIAEAIFGLTKEKAGGRFIHEYDAILRAARRSRG